MRSFLLPAFLFLWTPCVSAVIHSPDSPQLRERVERLESQYRTDQQINERALRLAEGFNQRSLEEQKAYQDRLLEKYTSLQEQYVSLEEQLKDTRDWTDTVITFWMTMSGLVATIFGIGVPLITQRKYEEKLRRMVTEETNFLDLKARSILTDNKSKKMDLYDQMISLRNSSFHTYTMRGDLFLELNSYKEATLDYNRAIELVKENMKSAMTDNLRKDLSYIYWKLGQAAKCYYLHNEAVKFYDLALEQTPKDAQVLLSHGHVCYNAGDIEQAYKYYAAAQKHSKYNDYIHCISSGYLAINNKEYEQAVRLFVKAINLHPKSFVAYLGRADAYSRKKKFKNAEADYNKAIKLNRKNSIAYNNRGDMYSEQSYYDKSLSDYTKAIDLDPYNALIYNNRGNLYTKQTQLGNLDKALADYNRASELNPKYADVYYNRGNLHATRDQKDDLDKALADYNRAIELNPEYADAYNKRGELYRKQSKFDLALKDFNIAVIFDPNNVEIYENRGNLHNDTKNFSEAIEDFSKALDIDPYNLYALFQINELQKNISKSSEVSTNDQ